MKNLRGPDAREKRFALSLGLVLVRRLNGSWAARRGDGVVVYVIDGTNAGWRGFRRFVAPLLGTGFRF